jgi:predicted lipoprotein with Yx(FWY)xxD motif
MVHSARLRFLGARNRLYQRAPKTTDVLPGVGVVGNTNCPPHSEATTQMIQITRFRLAGALPLILLLAACSTGGGATSAPSAAVPSAAPSTAASPSAAASPSDGASPSEAAEGGEYPLTVASGHLAGKDGMSLYIFKKDTKDSGKSVCNGDCATNWPPYEADEVDEVEAEGASGALTIVTRDDGSKQLAYNGWPLYYFAGDKAAGDTNGATIPNWELAKP